MCHAPATPRAALSLLPANLHSLLHFTAHSLPAQCISSPALHMSAFVPLSQDTAGILPRLLAPGWCRADAMRIGRAGTDGAARMDGEGGLRGIGLARRGGGGRGRRRRLESKGGWTRCGRVARSWRWGAGGTGDRGDLRGGAGPDTRRLRREIISLDRRGRGRWPGRWRR